MSQNVNAEIIAIGTEILLGEITDTNSVHIAHVLRDIGINLYFMTSVGDNEQRIVDAIRIALDRADVVITCGGLGPTVDDMTRQAVATATKRGLTFHQDLLDKIAERFAGFRAQMTENNRQQAYLPDSSIVIENPVGTAPSFIVEYENKVVISLPGVPREMKFLLAERVVPFLKKRYQLDGKIIKARVLKTAGIGESLLDAEIGKTLLQQNNPTVGLAAHSGQVDVRITAKAESEAEADNMIAIVEAHIRERVGKFIFGVNNDRIEDVLVQLLNANAGTLVISETGIGEPISQRIKQVANGVYVLKNVEIYENPDALRVSLAVDSAMPIRELAEHVALTLCKQANATAAIAVVCRPELNADQADSEDGTAIAVYTPQKSRSRAYGFGGQSEMAQAWSSTWGMSMLWQLLQEQWDDR
ncbi:MAG: CinA family nicotinamide mononucleotide deamidase-related protein [Anaerolineae bacterium]|nr:CinA family nicotinamide mononucleotide deamidase-related protein [Anaerolineae bacterium]